MAEMAALAGARKKVGTFCLEDAKATTSATRHRPLKRPPSECSRCPGWQCLRWIGLSLLSRSKQVMVASIWLTVQSPVLNLLQALRSCGTGS